MTGYWDCRTCSWEGREPDHVVPPGWGRATSVPPGGVPVQTSTVDAADARPARLAETVRPVGRPG